MKGGVSMNIDKSALGKRIQSIRKQSGKTLQSFGETIDNADKSLVSRWEKGLTVPSNPRLKLIADAGGISVDELLYGNIESYVYNLYLSILDDKKNDNDPTLPASLLDDMRALAPNKFKDTYADALNLIEYFRLSYEDEDEILKILKELILKFRFDEEYTNEGTINFVKSKVEYIYEYDLLDYFFYPREGDDLGVTDKLDNLIPRDTVSPELYDDILEVLEKTNRELELIKKKYPNIEK